MTLNSFVAYVKQFWKNKPDASTPLSAERLTHMEEKEIVMPLKLLRQLW